MSGTHVLTGGRHRQAPDKNGTRKVIERGETFTPTEHELATIGDKLTPVGGPAPAEEKTPAPASPFVFNGVAFASETALSEFIQGGGDLDKLTGQKPGGKNGYTTEQVREVLPPPADDPKEGDDNSEGSS